VCRSAIAISKNVYVWRPSAAEIEQYKTVYVHADCRRRLIAGERPPGVVRHGLTPQQAMTLVEGCEELHLPGLPDENGHHPTWSAYEPAPNADPFKRPLKRELRAARLPYAVELEKATEATGSDAHRHGRQHLHTFDNLQLVIAYLQRHDQLFRHPLELMSTLRDLARRKKLHTLSPTIDDTDWDYLRF
jgi:hypothetical protein